MADEQPVQEKFALSTSRGFSAWLARSGGSLMFTTYQAGKVFFVGLKPDGKLWVFERTFPRCMGIGVSADGRSFALATQYQIYRFDNVLPRDGRQGQSDAVFAPHASWITGDLDVHDVAMPADGRPLFANTLFSCVASVSDGYSFRPLWRPPFITKMAAEDRCHLNGLALRDGIPAYATAIAATDAADGWRDRRRDGGVLMDIASGEVAVNGLSMPHSPRLHDGKLWLLNSGAGEFGVADVDARTFQPVAFCPGYARGLAFANGCAVVGLSLARENRTFQGLPLDDALQRRNVDPRCGLLVIDLASGDTVEWVRLEGVVQELYDVAFLPGVTTPSAIGLRTDEIRRVISVDDDEVAQPR